MKEGIVTYADSEARTGTTMETTMAPAIPASLDEIDLQWTRDVLSRTSGLDPSLLRGLKQEPIGKERGFVSQLVRLHLDWERPSAGPATLVTKLNAPNPTTAAFAKLAYEHEYVFYQHFATHVPVSTPHCYYADYDPDKIRFVLVLEDLSQLKAGDQIAGTGDADVANAIRSLARLHATFWNDGEIQRFLGDAASEPQLPFTLLHGDYRLDNMFFGGSDDLMTVIDWGVRMGKGSEDLGYFLLLSLTPEQFRQQWRELTGLYYRTLVKYGVRDYSLRQLQNECRFLLLVFAVLGIVIQGVIDYRDSGGPSTGDDTPPAIPDPGLAFLSSVIENHRGLLLMETWIERIDAALGIWGFVPRLIRRLVRAIVRSRNRHLRRGSTSQR